MESDYYSIACLFGQIIGVFFIVFVFVIFPVLGIIYLVKHRKLKRKEPEFKAKKHDHKSYKM